MQYRPKILVAEDTLSWRELLSGWLRREGYRLYFACSGKEVLPRAERHHPDCIILDFQLGDQTALEVCKTIKSKRHLEAIPIIILTVHSEEKIQSYSGCKADHFVLKSRSPDELLAVLGATLRRSDWDQRILEKGDIRLVLLAPV